MHLFFLNAYIKYSHIPSSLIFLCDILILLLLSHSLDSNSCNNDILRSGSSSVIWRYTPEEDSRRKDSDKISLHISSDFSSSSIFNTESVVPLSRTTSNNSPLNGILVASAWTK